MHAQDRHGRFDILDPLRWIFQPAQSASAFAGVGSVERESDETLLSQVPGIETRSLLLHAAPRMVAHDGRARCGCTDIGKVKMSGDFDTGAAEANGNWRHYSFVLYLGPLARKCDRRRGGQNADSAHRANDSTPSRMVLHGSVSIWPRSYASTSLQASPG
jgi:hypothetical protein